MRLTKSVGELGEKMMKDDQFYIRSIQRAERIIEASKLHNEKTKASSFRLVLAEILACPETEAPSKDAAAKPGADLKPVGTKKNDIINQVLKSHLSYEEFADIIEKGSLQDRSLVVLKVIRDELGIDGLTPSEVATVLTRQLRLPSIHSTNVSNKLRGAKKLTTRIEDAGAYRYSLTRFGDKYIEDQRIRLGGDNNS
jgi:hypothetical protein